MRTYYDFDKQSESSHKPAHTENLHAGIPLVRASNVGISSPAKSFSLPSKKVMSSSSTSLLSSMAREPKKLERMSIEMINDISKKKKEEEEKQTQKKRESIVPTTAIGAKKSKISNTLEISAKGKETTVARKTDGIESKHNEPMLPSFAPVFNSLDNLSHPSMSTISSVPDSDPGPSFVPHGDAVPSSKVNILDLTQLFADSPLLNEEHRKIISEFNESLKTGLLSHESSGPDDTRKFKLREDRRVDESTGEIVKETMFLTLRYDVRTWQKTKKKQKNKSTRILRTCSTTTTSLHTVYYILLYISYVYLPSYYYYYTNILMLSK